MLTRIRFGAVPDLGLMVPGSKAVIETMSLVLVLSCLAATLAHAQNAGAKAATRIGQIRVLIGNWCRQSTLLKAGDVVFHGDLIFYCGNPWQASDQIVIRLELSPQRYEDRPFSCREPGTCDVRTNLLLGPLNSHTPRGIRPISKPATTSQMLEPAISPAIAREQAAHLDTSIIVATGSLYANVVTTGLTGCEEMLRIEVGCAEGNRPATGLACTTPSVAETVYTGADRRTALSIARANSAKQRAGATGQVVVLVAFGQNPQCTEPGTTLKQATLATGR